MVVRRARARRRAAGAGRGARRAVRRARRGARSGWRGAAGRAAAVSSPEGRGRVPVGDRARCAARLGVAEHAELAIAAGWASRRCSRSPSARRARRSTSRSALVAEDALGLTPVVFLVAGCSSWSRCSPTSRATRCTPSGAAPRRSPATPSTSCGASSRAGRSSSTT